MCSKSLCHSAFSNWSSMNVLPLPKFHAPTLRQTISFAIFKDICSEFAIARKSPIRVIFPLNGSLVEVIICTMETSRQVKSYSSETSGGQSNPKATESSVMLKPYGTLDPKSIITHYCFPLEPSKIILPGLISAWHVFFCQKSL
jgi:hypothetical protein